jgi:hypothetical protein
MVRAVTGRRFDAAVPGPRRAAIIAGRTYGRPLMSPLRLRAETMAPWRRHRGGIPPPPPPVLLPEDSLSWGVIGWPVGYYLRGRRRRGSSEQRAARCIPPRGRRMRHPSQRRGVTCGGQRIISAMGITITNNKHAGTQARAPLLKLVSFAGRTFRCIWILQSQITSKNTSLPSKPLTPTVTFTAT